MDIKDIILIVTGAFNIILGSIILLRNKGNHINISFTFFSYSLAGWALGIAFFRLSEDSRIALMWAKEYYIAASFIAASLLYFAHVFPEGKKLTLKKRLLIIIPSFVHAFLISLPFYLTRSIVVYPWGKEVILGKIEYFIYSIYFLPFFYGALYILWTKYKKYTGHIKRQVSFVLVSILLASIFGVTFNLFLPWLGNYQLIYLGPPFTMIIFWFIAYAIIRQRLWDFRLVFAKVIAYVILTIILGALYSLGLLVIGQLLTGRSTNSNELLTSAVFALIIALSFQPLRKSLEKITDKIFYKGYYDSQELLKSLSSIMATTLELQLLTLRILDEVTQTMKIRRSVFVLLSKDEKQIEYTEYEAYDQKPIFERKDIEPFIQDKRITNFDDLEEGEIKELMRKLNISVTLRLSVKGQKIGVLFLGEKSSGDIYSEQDIDVLDILAPQLSIAIQNAREYEEIKRFNVTLSEEVEKATKEIKDANSKLKQLDKTKDEFVSVASHELRTPMTVIKSYIWLLLNDKTLKLTDKQKTNLDRTYSSVERLITLVNDMLNVSRIQSGKILIDAKPTDIKKLCEETIAEMQPRAQEEKIDISLDCDKDLPPANIDPNKTKEIIINLVGNSLKFTPEGGKINVRLSNVGAGSSRPTVGANHDSPDKQILVSVTDTGFGIKAENMPKLFQKFGIVGNNYLQKNITQGTGLGLYISKSITELQGGKMWAESEGEGKGATFSFTVCTS